MDQQPQVPEGDLLISMTAIARHLGITVRQALHLKDTHGLPTFKQGATVCARKSSLAEHFRLREGQARCDVAVRAIDQLMKV